MKGKRISGVLLAKTMRKVTLVNSPTAIPNVRPISSVINVEATTTAILIILCNNASTFCLSYHHLFMHKRQILIYNDNYLYYSQIFSLIIL